MYRQNLSMTDDSALVQQFRMPATRKKAFEVIVSRYSKVLFNHISRSVSSREDAEDVLQSVWIKAWRGLDHFRGECQLSTWLFTIATREVCSKYREKKRVQTTVLEDKHEGRQSTEQGMPDAQVIEAKLQEAIQELPEKQLQVFIMRYFEEMTYEEMANVTGTSVGALKASYHHAVKKIEQKLVTD